MEPAPPHGTATPSPCSSAPVVCGEAPTIALLPSAQALIPDDMRLDAVSLEAGDEVAKGSVGLLEVAASPGAPGVEVLLLGGVEAPGAEHHSRELTIARGLRDRI
jgi:hypothetical protein